MLKSLLQYVRKGTVVVLATGKTTVDDAHQFGSAPETELLVAGPEDVVVEHVFDALLGQS